MKEQHYHFRHLLKQRQHCLLVLALESANIPNRLAPVRAIQTVNSFVIQVLIALSETLHI